MPPDLTNDPEERFLLPCLNQDALKANLIPGRPRQCQPRPPKSSRKSFILLTEKESPTFNSRPENSSMPTAEVRLALANNGENSRRKFYQNY